MIIPIPANKERFKIHIGIKAKYPTAIGLQCYDPRYAHTYYLRRKARFNKTRLFRCFTLSFPVAPKYLELDVFDKITGEDDSFSITSFSIEKMEVPSLWASDAQHRFLDFATHFAQKAGYTPTGYYDSKDQEFLFHYLPSITDNLGNEMITPARTHRLMPRVQISKRMFQPLSIPIRVAILVHEGCHWFLNTRSQKTADLCGLRQYLDYGFPKIEAVYAMTKIFGNYPELVGTAQLERTRDVIQFIENYS